MAPAALASLAGGPAGPRAPARAPARPTPPPPPPRPRAPTAPPPPSRAPRRAAEAVATAIAADRRVFVASTSHVLHSELVMRAGGLAAVHALGEPPDFSEPMLDLRAGALEAIGPFQPTAGDIVLIGTNAGTDAGTVEVAAAARSAGCVVVGLTCVAYEAWPDVVRDHPTGARLMDLADILV